MYNFLRNNFKAALTVLCSLSGGFLFASEIDTIDIKVILDEDGSARIKEHWVVDVDHSNTEWYLSMKNYGDMVISDFKVFDNDSQSYLKDDSPWNVDRSRDEKAGKCGVNRLTGNDCELCWGVGSSGPHNWTAEYLVKGFVKQYEDGCGFNHCFVNYGLSAGPKYVRTSICMADSTPLSIENARIWAFQYAGTCRFIDGKVIAESTEPLTTDNSMIVMCIFPQNFVSSPNVVNDTIGKMKWKALEGSDYLENYSEEDYAKGSNVYQKNNDDDFSVWEEILFCLVVLAVGGILYIIGYAVMAFGLVFGFIAIWNVVSLRPLRIFLRQRKLLKGSPSPYYRDLPINGNLNRAFFIIDETNYRVLPLDKDNLYAAYLVRMMRFGALKMTTTVEKGKSVERLAVETNFPKMNGQTRNDYDCMKCMYEVMRKAAGKNLILEKGELKAYLEKTESAGSSLERAVGFDDASSPKPEEYQQLMGLKKFLNDFTLIAERGVVEVRLWDEYLVYATLFGMADKVLKQFQECCPEYFQKSLIGRQLIDADGNVISSFRSFTGISSVTRHLAHTSSTSSSSRSGGGGGYSSSGGGGGCSGGGGGGGGR